MTCPFCTLDPKRNTIIENRKNCFVMFSNPRLMEGHLLVIPKRHVERLSELNEQEKKELLETVIGFEEKLLKIFPGCDIRQNYRPFVKQSDHKVNHLHIHLQPRTMEDDLYKKVQVFEKDVFKWSTKNEESKLIKLLS